MEGRRFPLGCSLGATSAFAIHLAREGQVGVGVDPTLDDGLIIGHGCGECQHTTHAVKSDHGKVSYQGHTGSGPMSVTFALQNGDG